MASLHFHQELFDGLGLEPRVSQQSLAVIAEREKVCGVKFPAAVTEWLSLEGVFELFRNHTNEDGLVTNNTKDARQALARLGNPEETSQGWLRVAVENQGVVAWYVKLDGSEDPPVFHNNDDWSSPLGQVKWVACADRFSTYLRELILGRG